MIAAHRYALLLAALALVPPAPPASAQSVDETLATVVAERERAFAATMADRDLAAFGTFVSAEAVFFGADVLRGRSAVVDGWAPFFEGAAAPFSWEPTDVAVLASGELALSSGPVFDPAGRRAGTFNSVWRLEPDGVWRVVFDKGCDCSWAR